MVRRLFAVARAISIVACIIAPNVGYAITSVDYNSIVNDTPFYDANDSCNPGAGSTTTLFGNDNEQKAFNYFLGKGLTKYQSAAIIGNLMQESGVNPNAQQPGGPGMGIAQWSRGGRWDSTPQDNLLAFANNDNISPTDLAVQLDFMWYELNGPYKKALTELKSVTGTTTADLSTAVMYIANDYEQAGIIGPRLQFAEQALGLPTTGVGATTSASTSCQGGTVDCTGTQPAQPGLSATRQNIVCIAKAELKKWQSGQLKPADGYLGYSQNRVEEWCADFASWVYDQAKFPLRNDPNWNYPGVAEIQVLAQSANMQQTDKFSFTQTPKVGDLAIHGSQHVNIVIGVSGSNLTLIGGDQGPGPYPGGSYVSQYTTSSAAADGITGFVSPNN